MKSPKSEKEKEKKEKLGRPNIGMLVEKEQLQIGDVLELEWTDVQAHERLSIEQLQALTDPEPTRTWGVVVKLLPESVVIAHELSDPTTDGCWASTYPFRLIDFARLLARVDIEGVK